MTESECLQAQLQDGLTEADILWQIVCECQLGIWPEFQRGDYREIIETYIAFNILRKLTLCKLKLVTHLNKILQSCQRSKHFGRAIFSLRLSYAKLQVIISSSNWHSNSIQIHKFEYIFKLGARLSFKHRLWFTIILKLCFRFYNQVQIQMSQIHAPPSGLQLPVCLHCWVKHDHSFRPEFRRNCRSNFNPHPGSISFQINSDCHIHILKGESSSLLAEIWCFNCMEAYL